MSHNFPKFQHLLLVCLMTAITGVAEAGSVQFSTYYPAPFGMYDRLRLVPRANLDAQLPCDPGTMYINTDAGNQLEVCNAAGDDWAPLSGGPWTEDINGVYVTDITANVGIGTTAPTSRLHVLAEQGDDPSPGVFFEDTDITVNGGADGVFGLRNSSATGTRKISIGGPGLGTETMMIDVLAGRVGIGTTTPGAKLHIRGANDTAEVVAFMPGADTGAPGTPGLNVGIGTITPAQQLEITGNLELPPTTSAPAGVIYSGGNRFIHNYGTNNFFAGVNAGNLTTTGVGGNTGVGISALSSLTNTPAGYNTAIGYNALFSNTSGGYNTASGAFALRSNTIGSYNTATGRDALRSNINGIRNTANGYWALYSNNSASSNTASGYMALYSNTSGSSNTATGYQALYSNIGGFQNTASGVDALFASTGNNNIAIGYAAGNNITTGSKNIIIGSDIDAPSATADNQLSIGNLIFGTGLDGTGTTISTGRVGIGTTSPLEFLHLMNASPGLRLERTNNANRNMVFFYPAGAVGVGNEVWGMGVPSAANYFTIGYDTDATPPGIFVLNITNAGNVGIGTTDPGTNRLEVVGGPIKATGGMILPTCTIAAGACPATPVDGQIWLCTDC